MIIQPKIRGFICTTAHPEGCAAHVDEQIQYVRSKGNIPKGPKRALVVGASTGYGLASRIVPAFACDAATIGVFFEKAPERGRPGSAGWYNSAAFEKEAHSSGLYAKSINGDAFSDAIRQQTIDLVKADLDKIDLFIYSLASPRRTHPQTGENYKSVLKPIGESYTAKTVDTDKGIVSDITIEPATEQEIADTVQVMGGEDWKFWMDALEASDAIAGELTTVAYSYIGPDITWPIYRNGTIGSAKTDLENKAHEIAEQLSSKNGRAFVSINKALVTQASSAIPVVPLYISLLYRVMKQKGLHEGCIEQIERLFSDRLYGNNDLALDEKGRIRIDDWEMREDVQSAVAELWPKVTTESLEELSDIAGYRAEFLKLFGFGLPSVDYGADVDTLVQVPSISES